MLKLTTKDIALRAAALVVLVLFGTTSTAKNVSASPTLAAGMLPAGTHPLEVIDVATSNSYRLASDAAPSVTVTNYGGSLDNTQGGWQRQVYRLQPGDFEITLLAANEPPVRPLGTYLSELVIQGIYFTPAPVLWRPTNAAGLVVAGSPWSWTINSSNGGVTLSQTSVAQEPATEFDDGVPVSVQRIDTTFTFSGTASGTLRLTHWEDLGAVGRVREHFDGTVSLFGSVTTMNTTVVLGGLGGLPGQP